MRHKYSVLHRGLNPGQRLIPQNNVSTLLSTIGFSMFSRCILLCLIIYVVYAAGDCKIGDNVYEEGDTLPSIDNCNNCMCVNGGAACTRMRCYENKGKCYYGGKEYGNGEDFMNIDGCNSCMCNNGVVACTRKQCMESVDCLVNGEVIKSGTTFKYDCNTCKCTSSGFTMCTRMLCRSRLPRSSTNGGCTFRRVDYQVGDTFMDGCNTCYCASNDAIDCTMRWCTSGAPRHGMTILSFLVVLLATLCVMKFN